MNNYTTETYQVKRNILKFTEKISVGLYKPTIKFASDMVYGILSSKSTLLSKIGRNLKEEIKLKNTIERLSDNLQSFDDNFRERIEENYYKEVMKFLPKDYVIVLNDDTDLNKEYSKKLEDLCVVRDASSKQEKYVNGYKVCEYTALTLKEKSPISLYSNIYSTTSVGFKSENDETIKGENKVKEVLEKYNRKPIFTRDRGYDANVFFINDLKTDTKFVTRLKGNRNLLFKGKPKNVEEVAKSRKGKIQSNLIYKGENKKCYISYTRVKLPAYQDKEMTLLIVHGLSDDGVPMMLLTNLDVNNPNEARRIVKIYFLRWRIEEYFKAKKSFDWENSLVRSLQSMNTLNLFLSLAMSYLSLMAEKIDNNFLVNIILERSMSLVDKALVYISRFASGIYKILKYAQSGIKAWQHIEKRKKSRQLQFNFDY